MPYRSRLTASHAARRFVVWCLLVALPVFGFSATRVELLGSRHVHRTAIASSTDDPMRGWIDMRRAPGVSTRGPGHAHSHGLFERHHHDRGDADVIALDAGAAQGDASDEGGASGGSGSHVMAATDLASPFGPPLLRFAWCDECSAPAMPWTSDGPMRPPKR